MNMSFSQNGVSKNVPPGPRGLPVVGVMPKMARDPLQYLLALSRRYPHLCRLRNGWYFMYRPDEVKHVLQGNWSNYGKGASIAPLKPGLGEGLITSEGELWRRQRRLAQPAFHSQRLAGLVQAMGAAAEAMRARWMQCLGGVVDLSTEMRRVTLDIVGRALFSRSMGLEADTFAEALAIGMEITNDRFFSMLPIPYHWPTPQNRRFDRVRAILDEVVFRIIAERRRGLATAPPDLLTMLMEARDEETGETMPDRQLRDECMTILIAGHDSTSQSLCWTFYLLATHPEVEARVRDEIERVVGQRPVRIEDLPKLEYCSMVIHEALRLYPTAWLMSRSPKEDDEISGFRVPKSSVLLMSPFVTHRHPDIWPDPERFDPERFAQGRLAHQHKFAFWPFGGGPRLCIGSQFSIFESQVALVTALQSFRMELVPDQRIELQPMITIRPRYGIKVRLHAARS